MKRLLLLSLALRNFKGCRELSIAPEGLDFELWGDNAAGVTAGVKRAHDAGESAIEQLRRLA